MKTCGMSWITFFSVGVDTIKLYRKGELESLLSEANSGKTES